ncbi:MAG TPA: type II secretion system protein M [Xanthomonadaceae bacterium]|nr:type II secretion system protein M [Xanthomonadaceae bacterium]
MRGWWNARAPRERQVLAAGALLLALLLGYAVFWKPLAESRHTLREQVARNESELIWMRQAVPLAQSLQRGVVPGATADGVSLLARVDEGARRAALGGMLMRVEPVGSGEVRAEFDAVAFDALLLWLDTLAAQHGIVVTEITARRAEGVGLADVRLTLLEPGR